MTGNPPTLTLRPIGVIRTPHAAPPGTPIQPRRSEGDEGSVEVFEPFAPGLRDLDGFDRVWLLYWFHRAPEARMEVTPFMDTHTRGLFATRAPTRPNPIGLSCVRLLGVEGRTLHLADVDMVDGSPLLDIKPYVPDFDAYDVERVGWLAEATDRRVADERFTRKPKE